MTTKKWRSKKEIMDHITEIELDPGEKVYARPLRKDEEIDVSLQERRIIDNIDNHRNLKKLLDNVLKLQQGKTQVENFFQAMAPEAAMELSALMFDSAVPHKVRLDAIRDFLDRAGYSKVNKHAVASIDPNQSKQAMISLLLGSTKALKEHGIEIEDDPEEEP